MARFIRVNSKEKEVKVVPKIIYDKIKKQGVQTGSKVFGGWNLKSDIDYILPPDFKPSFNALEDSRYLWHNSDSNYQGEGFMAGYVKTPKGRKINLLYMDSMKDYRIWTDATRITLEAIKKCKRFEAKMYRKKNRVSFFQSLREILA